MWAVESLNQFEEQNKGKEDDIKAYRANHEVCSGGLTKTQVAQYYDKWAKTGGYDQQLNEKRYRGPECVASELANYYGEEKRKHVNVLDVAAGTGRIGAELHRLGCRNMDALDPSEGMLNKARARGVYTKLYNDFVGIDNPVPCPDGTYDALAVSGGFAEGHIPSTALLEFVRVVKPDGVICIAAREEYLDQVGEYCDVMAELEEKGKWRRLARNVIQNYAFGKNGILFLFQVLEKK